MRIGQVVKAKSLRPGHHVLVYDAEGQSSWNRVVDVSEQYNGVYITVSLEGIRDDQEIEAKSRVVAWL